MEDLAKSHKEIHLPQNRERSAKSKDISMTKEDDDKNIEKTVSKNYPSPLGLYSEDEKVLAYYNHQIYEAKVQKVESRKNKWRYYIHYNGWNTKWDEWVDEDQLLKYTQENVMKQKTLEKNIGKNGINMNVSKGKKRKNDEKVEKSNSSMSIIKKSSNVNIQIPSLLSKQLIDDWNFVTQQDKLVTLPRSPTIDEILTKYLKFKCKKNTSNNENDSIGEFTRWVRRNFDRALPMMLLYNKEHKQYSEAIKDGVSPSSVYGAEHLLRLFAKSQQLLAYLNIEEETLNHLEKMFIDFLKFLQRRKNTLFLSEYVDPIVFVEEQQEKNEE